MLPDVSDLVSLLVNWQFVQFNRGKDCFEVSGIAYQDILFHSK